MVGSSVKSTQNKIIYTFLGKNVGSSDKTTQNNIKYTFLAEQFWASQESQLKIT